ELQRIFILLRKTSGVDFTHYKQSTVERRLARRMALHRIDSLSLYRKYLEQRTDEVRALFEDMLINVTGFFREPDSFDALKEVVFPQLMRGRDPERPVRIWVPACSTGEEAYSIAIALMEFFDKEPPPRIQIFATDVSEAAIDRARSGRYLEDISEGVSPERLRRFFVKGSNAYQVSKTIRDMCVFARQNITRDPPFSNLDLLSCRNLLIYMGPVFQRRIIPTFHYALRPDGFLLLGQSETIGSYRDLFAPVDRARKIYVKKVTNTPRVFADFGGGVSGMYEEASRPAEPPRAPASDVQKEVDRILLTRFAPAGVVVNRELEILFFRGQTGRFLEPAAGAASWSLLRMAREGLAYDLRAAIHRADREHASVRKEGLRCRSNGGFIRVALEVIPVRATEKE
ncbi:MAG: protein-glutamate O-methyltransferase CheR, partial [Candidatus Eisenbacteria bacterium]|nr:protein-glutamate O-methyltransferase CheR [Candidatus Eisenbacteria bacterium]